MPEENNVPNSETPNDTTPPPETGTKGTGETPGTTTPTDTAEITRLKDALKKANAESAAHRHKANELDKLKEQIEAEKLSDKEKLEKRVADLQAQYDATVKRNQELATLSEIRLQAAAQGFDARAASKLIDTNEIERDEEGNPTNIDALLKKLKGEFPGLQVKPSTSSAGATNPARSQSTAPRELSWETITELQKNPEEYNRRNADGSITKWLWAHPHRYGQK